MTGIAHRQPGVCRHPSVSAVGAPAAGAPDAPTPRHRRTNTRVMDCLRREDACRAMQAACGGPLRPSRIRRAEFDSAVQRTWPDPAKPESESEFRSTANPGDDGAGAPPLGAASANWHPEDAEHQHNHCRGGGCGHRRWRGSRPGGCSEAGSIKSRGMSCGEGRPIMKSWAGKAGVGEWASARRARRWDP